MLTHSTLDQLNALGLQGMARAFTELNDSDQTAGLCHAEWLALLLDREAVHRHDKRLGARLRSARLRHQACPEDIDYRSPRGLDRRLMQDLLKGDWSVGDGQHLTRDSSIPLTLRQPAKLRRTQIRADWQRHGSLSTFPSLIDRLDQA